jgi:hypothetical protein
MQKVGWFMLGILYFELFWEKDPRYSIHLIKGKITGDGPWRVGECSFHLLGCNQSLALVWLLNPCIFKTFCRLLDSHQAK